jgi:hypothetical protein
MAERKKMLAKDISSIHDRADIKKPGQKKKIKINK